MDETTLNWFNKLEAKIDSLALTMTEKVTELSTTLMIYLPRQEDHEKRINKLEDTVSGIKADNQNRSRNHNVWLGVGTITATIIAVIIGILVDRYLFKGGG